MTDSHKGILTRRRFCSNLMFASAALGFLKADSLSSVQPTPPKIDRKIKLGIVEFLKQPIVVTLDIKATGHGEDVSFALDGKFDRLSEREF